MPDTPAEIVAYLRERSVDPGMGWLNQAAALIEARPPIDITDEMLSAAAQAYSDYGRKEIEAEHEEALREALEAAVAVLPSLTMVPVKVTLISADGHEEVELGPFSQGVHIKKFDPTAPLSIYDTAGQPTKNAVARFFPNLGWMIEGDALNKSYYIAHVQAVTS